MASTTSWFNREMMPLFTFLRRRYIWFGLAGTILVSACILISALVYHGGSGESYSVFNHFISELGEVGVSRLAWLFNAGMILGGLLILPFVVGLGLTLPGWLSKLGAAAGMVAALALAGVGIFPMNNLGAHTIAATTYFRAGLVMVLFFGLAIQLQPKDHIVIDKRANLMSLVAVACYSAFLFGVQPPATQGSGASVSDFLANRPAFMVMAILEWSIFFSTVAWFFVIALAGRRRSG